MGGRRRGSALGWGALVWWCLGGAAAAEEPAPSPAAPYPRIVFVSIDTLRADHLGLYGYPRDTSPFLDELAERSVVFERAYAPMPITAPSHATLFTGLHPLQHGVRSNGMQLSAKVATLAERLAAGGFTTAGVTSTWVQWEPTGLSRGFSVFLPRPKEDFAGVYRRAHATVEVALGWLRTCGACSRHFLFVHLFDPHAPLIPPHELLRRFHDAGPEARAEHVAYLTERHGLDLGFFEGDPERMLSLIDRYDAEILFADAHLRRLYEAVSALPGPTLWVITADHGEGLGSHRFLGHGKAYEEGLRVPMLWHASDGSLPARRVTQLVSHVDVAPTLVELAGLPALSPSEGRSLAGLLRGAEPARPRTGVFAQRANMPKESPHRLAIEDPGDLSGPQFAWIEQRWKYLHHATGADELYDLASDPVEARNLLSSTGEGGAPPEAKRLRERLLEELGQLRRFEVEEAPVPELSEPELEELRALGYVP